MLADEATKTGVIEGDDSTLIRNCLLCNAKESKNGYTFKEGVFSKAVEMYTNAPVFLNHGDRKKHPLERGIEGVAGKIVNVRLEGGQPRADIETQDAPQGETLRKIVRLGVRDTGLSHTGRYRMNKNVVESIDRIYSVDAVISPATTKSFYEQSQLTQEEDSDTKVTEEKIKELETKLATAVERADKAEARIVELSTENKTLSGQVASFEAEKLAVETRKVVLEALKTAEIDAADADVCSEAFIATLCEASDERRVALISERSALVKRLAGAPAPKKESKTITTERKEIQTEKWDAAKELESGDIFA